MLDKFLLQESTDEERLQFLTDSADEVVEQTYHVRLDASEITAKRAEFTKQSLALRRLKIEKKKLLDDIKERAKPIAALTDDLAEELNTGYTRKHGRLYKYASISCDQ